MYTIYDLKISEVVQPELMKISTSVDGTQIQNYEEIVKDLVQLAMQLKSFAAKGLEHFPVQEFEVAKYETWFNGGIDQMCKVYASKELLSR